MERNDRKTNSRNHSVTMERDSKFVVRKIIFDFIIVLCGKFKLINSCSLFTNNCMLYLFFNRFNNNNLLRKALVI